MEREATNPRLNNFSLLRMIFASLVIISHSFELIDGNRSREILTQIFGTISFGMLAVDGFFLVSGYLITKSYLSSWRLDYVAKRVLRIYPGFIVAFTISLLVCQYFFAPGLLQPYQNTLHNIVNLIFLQQPNVPGAYPGFPWSAPDGSMWTISYEFRCYVMVMLFGVLGIFRKKWVLSAITIFLLYYGFIYSGPYALDTNPTAPTPDTGDLHKIFEVLIQTPFHDIQLFGVFLAGSCFYNYREIIPFRHRYALAAAILLCSCLFYRRLAEPGVAIFGGYIVVWFALHIRAFPFSKFLNKMDLSYGVYLYAWPIQKILIAEIRHINPYGLMALTFVFSVVAAYLSWTFIEKPFLGLKLLLRQMRPAAIAIDQPAGG